MTPVRQKTITTQITDIIQRTEQVKSFRLDDQGGVEYAAGQFMKVSFDGSEELSRWLSFSSSPTERGFFEFTKKLTKSKFSQALDRAEKGETLRITYPFGHFTYRPAAPRLGFLSGGIGITPVRSICKFLTDTNSPADIVLIYGNRNRRSIAFADDLDLMEGMNPRLKVVHVLSQPDEVCSWHVGTIDQEIIREEISDYAQRLFYLCGPPCMVEGMKKILSDGFALPQGAIVTENFTGY